MDGIIPKIQSKNIKMYVMHVEKKCKKKVFGFTWKLPDFFKQEKLALFTKQIERYGLNLILKQEMNSFVLTIFADKYEILLDISCSVLSNGTYILPSIDSEQVSKNIYRFRFTTPDFKYLKEYICINSHSLELKIEISEEKQFFCSGNYDADYSRFVELVKPEVSMKRFSSDFAFKTNQGLSIYCATSLLAARSKLFRNHLDESNDKKNNVIIITTTPILCALITYLYTGRLFCNSYMIVDLIKLAEELDIPSLKKSCSSLSWLFKSSNNTHDINNVGIQSRLISLVKNEDKFLKNTNAAKLKKSRISRRRRR